MMLTPSEVATQREYEPDRAARFPGDVLVTHTFTSAEQLATALGVAAKAGLRFDPARPVSNRHLRMLRASNALHGSFEFNCWAFLKALVWM